MGGRAAIDDGKEDNMKQLKAIGLIAVATAAILVVLGGSASATVLCKVTPVEGECPETKEYALKETILGNLQTGTSFTYEALNALNEVQFVGSCQEASVSWSNTENRGPEKALIGTVTALLFGKCKNGLKPCEKVTAQNLPYGAELLPGLGGNGVGFFVNGTAARKIKFENCVFGINCVYEPAEMQVSFIGGNPATIATILWEFKSEGGNLFCGTKIKMKGKYEVAAPKPVWVAPLP
jgi:hypothetical protein